ncbi:MAG TPA: metallophosphatase domain-containing protein [Labilithrix sp.]
MRIVAIADTHLRHAKLDVPDGDVLVHAGDLLAHGTLDELARATDWLRAMPHRTKVVVAGNHEVCLQRDRDRERARAMLDGFVYLEDAAATIDGLVFWGSPWQPRFAFWAFGLARGPELAAKWALVPDRVDVLVTHGPPRGFGDRVRIFGSERHVGDDDLLRRVREVRPRLHLFGHIHQDPGRWSESGNENESQTIFANVTTDDGTLPASIFDL